MLTGLPFLSVKGNSAIRFDIGELKLFFFGSVIRISEFYLLLAAILFFLLFITFVTTVFGRVWCGWLCPQTVLLDLTEYLASFFGRKKRRMARNILLLPFSALVSLTMIWYFVPPLETIRGLFTSSTITAFFLVLWILVYSELAFLGRKFCTSVCPYAMMQNALFDKDTLIIEYDRSRDDTCMKCDECVRVCPVGIDIKQGLNSRCIACAECIDVCRAISSRRDLPPFPDYRGRPLRPKTFILGGVTAAAGALLAFLIWMRPPVDFLVTREQEPLPKGVNRYSYTVTNNSHESLELELSASPDGTTIIGERKISLAPFGSIHGKVLVKAPDGTRTIRITLSGKGKALSRETGFL